MAGLIGSVISQLRDMIVAGELEPGERVIELQFAAQLGVSRTPLRIALGELEREGLLERLPSRGFRVRAYSIDDIADAVDVRGVLEGMAVRLVAERGASGEVLKKLSEAVARGHALLQPALGNPRAKVDGHAWSEINRRFHAILVEAAGNRALASALEHNNRTPLSGPGALTLPKIPSAIETAFLLRAQADHEDLLQAIIKREAARAENLMREHAYRSRDNKRLLLARIRGDRKAAARPKRGAAASAAPAPLDA